MRWLGYVLSVLAVIGLAVWAYGQNHQTQTAMAELRDLRREIRQLREALDVQNAEWAFLNRPDRLRVLADLNFERLGLLALTGERFGRIDEIAYPLPAQLVDGPAEDQP
jgi:hypothetical protein